MAGLITRSKELDIKDIELTLRIRHSPAECILVEVKDGGATVSFEHDIVKEVPFQRKKRKSNTSKNSSTD